MKNIEGNFKVRDGRRKGYFTVDNELVDDYLAIIGATAYAVYCVICKYSDRKEESFPSQNTIAEKVGVHLDTVVEKIKILRLHNLINITHTKEEKTGEFLHNIYTLMDKTVWVKHLSDTRTGKASIPTKLKPVQVKHLYGPHTGKTSVPVTLNPIQMYSDANKTYVLTIPIVNKPIVNTSEETPNQDTKKSYLELRREKKVLRSKSGLAPGLPRSPVYQGFGSPKTAPKTVSISPNYGPNYGKGKNYGKRVKGRYIPLRGGSAPPGLL